MITFGFNTLAMLTYGLGIRMPWGQPQVFYKTAKISFENKPSGMAAEDSGAVSSKDSSIGYEPKEVEFK